MWCGESLVLHASSSCFGSIIHYGKNRDNQQQHASVPSILSTNLISVLHLLLLSSLTVRLNEYVTNIAGALHTTDIPACTRAAIYRVNPPWCCFNHIYHAHSTGTEPCITEGILLVSIPNYQPQDIFSNMISSPKFVRSRNRS